MILPIIALPFVAGLAIGEGERERRRFFFSVER
jgi:hypothetical protein